MADVTDENVQYNNHSPRSKWSAILGTNINEVQWKKIFRPCFKTIKTSDFIWFQYRIINRILETRSFLHKVKISSNPNCIYCDSSPETIEHLFLNCPFVADFWDKLRQWSTRKIGLYFKFNKFDIIFGIFESEPDLLPKNTLISVAKNISGFPQRDIVC